MAHRIYRAVLAVMIVSSVGCQRYPSPSSPDSLRLLASLRAACNYRNSERVAHVARAVDYTAERGRMTADEVKAFQKIIQIAKAGQWQTAEKECQVFQRGQVKTFSW